MEGNVCGGCVVGCAHVGNVPWSALECPGQPAECGQSYSDTIYDPSLGIRTLSHAGVSLASQPWLGYFRLAPIGRSRVHCLLSRSFHAFLEFSFSALSSPFPHRNSHSEAILQVGHARTECCRGIRVRRQRESLSKHQTSIGP